MHIINTPSLLIPLYLLPLLATVLAFHAFIKFLQSKRREVKRDRDELKKRNVRTMVENKKQRDENKDFGRKVGQIQDLYEMTREMGTALEFESTFQIFSKKLREMFSFSRAELVLLEESDGKMAVKRTLKILGEKASADDKIDMGGEMVKSTTVSPASSLIDMFTEGHQRGSIFIPDTGQSLQARRLSLSERVQSFAAIPLIMDKKILALMTMENMSEDVFDRLSIVSAQLALAMKKSRLYQEVQRLSIVDGLTGTFLRRHFLERFEEEIQRSYHHKLPLTFLMADIDHFKECNDKFGHLVGDVVLKEVSRLLREGVREIDLVGRYGGEEFSLLLTETDRESALQVANRLRMSVEEHQFKAYDEVGMVTISIGLATFPADAQELELLIDKADQALYKAKQFGRNKVCTLPKEK